MSPRRFIYTILNQMKPNEPRILYLSVLSDLSYVNNQGRESCCKSERQLIRAFK